MKLQSRGRRIAQICGLCFVLCSFVSLTWADSRPVSTVAQAPSPDGASQGSNDVPSLAPIPKGPLVTPAAVPSRTPVPTGGPNPPAANPMIAPVQRSGATSAQGAAEHDKQAQGEADIPLPPAGETVGEGDVQIDVQVKGPDHTEKPTQYDAPMPNQQVKLSVIRPPHEIVEQLVAVSGEDGIAHFRAQSGEGLQAFAQLDISGREVFAPNGIAIDELGGYTLAVQDEPLVSDPDVVYASRIITIVEDWEDYVVFTQIYRLATDAPVVFQAKMDGTNGGLRIPLPEGATGARVVQPADGAIATDNAILYRGKVKPAGKAGEQPTLIVRYSIEDNNVAEVSWTQRFPFDVEDLSLVVPQTTQNSRHPNLDVSIHVPMCDDADRASNVMCFASIDGNAEGVNMLQGTAVRIAHGGTVERGGEMKVTTAGWPADPHIDRWAAGMALGGGLLLAWLLFARARSASGKEEEVLERLAREREDILKRVEKLQRQLDQAEILEVDYEAERERIIGELALVERRIRNVRAAAAYG